MSEPLTTDGRLEVARQRARSAILLVALVMCDVAAITLSRGSHQTVVAILTVVGLVATLGLVVTLIIGNRDWFLRGAVAVVIAAWTGFKIYLTIKTLRNFD